MASNQQLYYASFQKNGDWYWKIYHYDPTGNKEVVIHSSPGIYDSGPEAEDACVEFMDDKNIEAELG